MFNSVTLLQRFLFSGLVLSLLLSCGSDESSDPSDIIQSAEEFDSIQCEIIEVPDSVIIDIETEDFEIAHIPATVDQRSHGVDVSDTGERKDEEIQAKLNLLKERIQVLYQGHLRNYPSAGGRMDILFSITPEGSVINISISAPAELSDMIPVVRETISSLEFSWASEQEVNVTVSVPMNLIPGY